MEDIFMANRVLGLKLESVYGEASATSPDFHQQVNKAKASLGDEPLTDNGGSRTIKYAKAGAMKPEASYDYNADLKMIGHYFLAFLGNYHFTGGGEGPNTHEFWGGENQRLPSFTAWSTFDEFMKQLFGAVLDSLKLEISDAFMGGTAEWKYKTEQKIDTIPTPSEQKIIPDNPLIAFYDVALELDGAAPPGVVSSFSFEGKNNLKVEKTLGLGSRGPQIKPNAGAREIKLKLESLLVAETVDLIEKIEYGAVGNSPSECKLYKGSIKLIVEFCEDSDDKLTVFFPECTAQVEYEASGADEIGVTFNLNTLGTKIVTLKDGTTKVMTDMYVLLENDQPEIKAGEPGTSAVTFLVKDNAGTPAPVVGANLKLTNRQNGNVLTAASATNAQGQCVVNNVPYGRYDIELKDSSDKVVVTTPAYVSINESTESKSITANIN
jgi:hypothetical protein